MLKNASPLGKALGLLSLAGLVGAVSLSSTWAADAGKDHAKNWAQHRQEWVRAKLDRDANRLEIKASQQAAWQQYANARNALAERTFSKPAEDADAATIAKAHAQRAAEIAQKLATLADATAKLQVVLAPEQIRTLDQIVRHGHQRHGHHGWHHGRDGLDSEGHEHASDLDQQTDAPPA